MKPHDLMRRQVERRLHAWYGVDRKPLSIGWVRTIREALGMTAQQLANRLGITRQGVSDLEAREREGGVTIAALRNAAAAMECDLVYAIVPRSTLDDTREDRARSVAALELGRVGHTMRLEGQATGTDALDTLIRERAANLLDDDRRLWEEPNLQLERRP